MQITSEVLKSLRKILGKKNQGRFVPIDLRDQAASDLIRRTIDGDQPCMICRFGSNELDATLRTYEGKRAGGYLRKAFQFIRGECAEFWWDRSIRKRMENVAGFFPTDRDSLSRFGERMLLDLSQIDILGSWREDESRLRPQFKQAKIVYLTDLEPYRHESPWSRALAGKKVLVIHPFEKSIRRQYERRHLLFQNGDVLPEFDLQTLKAVQSHGGNQVPFSTWFDAFDSMCERVHRIDFEVALIGAGAYGFPLAAFIKRLGRKAVHLGGVTQLLFGIKGHRWDSGYQHVYNEHWIRPLPEEAPQKAELVEQGAYW